MTQLSSYQALCVRKSPIVKFGLESHESFLKKQTKYVECKSKTTILYMNLWSYLQASKSTKVYRITLYLRKYVANMNLFLTQQLYDTFAGASASTKKSHKLP